MPQSFRKFISKKKQMKEEKKKDERRISVVSSSSTNRSTRPTRMRKDDSIELQPQPVPLHNPVSPNSLANLENHAYSVELLYDYWRRHSNIIEKELKIIFNNVIIFNFLICNQI